MYLPESHYPFCVISYVKKQQNANVKGFYLLKMWGKSVRSGHGFAFSGILNREAVQVIWNRRPMYHLQKEKAIVVMHTVNGGESPFRLSKKVLLLPLEK